jgi:hypothetical protein
MKRPLARTENQLSAVVFPTELPFAMDPEFFYHFALRLIKALVIAVVTLVSARLLGFSWGPSIALAAIPAILGSLNIMSGQIYVFCALFMVLACLKVILANIYSQTDLTMDDFWNWITFFKNQKK